MSRRRRWEAAVSALLLAGVIGLLVVQVADPWHREAARPWPVRASAPTALKLGVVTPALARNAFEPWRPRDLREVNAFEQHARRHADIVAWFETWAWNRDFDRRQAAAVAARGSVPEITWEPWDAAKGLDRAQPRFALARIAAGDHDAYVRRWARQIAAYGGPVRLRFAHEMNGRWYPWSEGRYGNRPGDFAHAWHHVHAIFTRAGARNVVWVWSPVAGALQASAGAYPGPGSVDVVGLSGFNGGTRTFAKEWRPFTRIYGKSLDFMEELAPGKPIALTELASAEEGGSKAGWISGMFAEIHRRPAIRALVWFNLDKETDWRIESSPAARRAFAAGISRASR